LGNPSATNPCLPYLFEQLKPLVIALDSSATSPQPTPATPLNKAAQEAGNLQNP